MEKNPAYWSALESLLFHKNTDYEKPLMWDHETVASFCGIAPDDRSTLSNFSSGAFIQAFRRDVLPGLIVSDHVPLKRCRTVVDRGLPEWLEELLAEELEIDVRRKEYAHDRVYFATGNRFRRQIQKRIREEEQQIADAIAEFLDMCEEQKQIREYLHTEVTPNIFTSLIKQNYQAALDTALELPHQNVREANLNFLRRIADQSIPSYRPVSNSYRLFDLRAGMQQLKREARKALLRGCYEADADALHIAIMARAWGVERLQCILRDGGGKAFWRALINGMAGREVDDPEEFRRYKDAVKPALYALGYGGGKPMVVSKFEANDEERLYGSAEEAVERMLALPFLVDLFEARERIIDTIQIDGGMESPFGKVELRKGRTPLTVMSMVSSAYEVRLISALFEAAQGRTDFKLILYLFDGVVVRSTDASKTAWKGLLTRAFDERARALGVETTLSIERI